MYRNGHNCSFLRKADRDFVQEQTAICYEGPMVTSHFIIYTSHFTVHDSHSIVLQVILDVSENWR